MFALLVFYSIVSFIIIFVIHNLYNFFKNNLTTPQVKDLVNKPTEKYKEMYSILNKDNTYSSNTFGSGSATETTSGSNVNKEKMKNDLKNYLKGITKGNKETNNYENIGNSNSGVVNNIGNIETYNNTDTLYTPL